MPYRVLPLVLVMFLVAPASAQNKPLVSRSDNCREVAGENQRDIARVLRFCEQGITKGAVTSVIAKETLLWVRVTREMATALRRDHISAEDLVLTWMRGWKQNTNSKSVTVYIEIGNVEVARGETTLLRGDVVTFR